MLKNKPREEEKYWRGLDRKKRNYYANKRVEELKKERIKMMQGGTPAVELQKNNKMIVLWQNRANQTGGIKQPKKNSEDTSLILKKHS